MLYYKFHRILPSNGGENYCLNEGITQLSYLAIAYKQEQTQTLGKEENTVEAPTFATNIDAFLACGP